MHAPADITDADDFFKWARANDPKRYDEVARRFPVNGWRSTIRHESGETYQVKDQRGPLSPGARKRLIALRAVREAYHREHSLDERFAKELADEGMRGY